MPEDATAQRVAAEVRAALARQRKPHRFVGEVLGLSSTAVSRRLRGETVFDVEELAKLATALGVTLASFMPTESAVAS